MSWSRAPGVGGGVGRRLLVSWSRGLDLGFGVSWWSGRRFGVVLVGTAPRVRMYTWLPGSLQGSSHSKFMASIFFPLSGTLGVWSGSSLALSLVIDEPLPFRKRE